VAETTNIAEIAVKISEDIFSHFLWNIHPMRDDNFACSSPDHKGGKKEDTPKKTHPGDAVFSYGDPYLGTTIYLHTDLKSYAKDSITSTSLRGAFRSLAMTIECANNSQDWRTKYSVDKAESHEVRGLLFVHNYDHGYEENFADAIGKIALENLPVAPNTYIHFLGPQDIQRLYNIGNDLVRLQHEKKLHEDYTFYYPDLVMLRRQGDVWGQPATIEALTGPYLIIKHKKTDKKPEGYVIYYNRSGSSVEEFEYFLDSLSRYQMLESGERISIRVTDANPDTNLKSNFHTAKKKYAKAWGFDPKREAILDQIDIDQVTSVTNTYNPGNMGWRE